MRPQVESAHERLRRLLKALHAIDPRQSLEDFIRSLAEAVVQTTQGDAVAIVTRRDDRANDHGLIVPRGPGAAIHHEQTWNDRPPLLGGLDPAPLFLSVGESGYHPLLERYREAGLRVRTTLSAPLVRRGIRFGFLEILNPENEDWKTPEGIDLFDALADEIGMLLDNALLLDRLKQERLENELLYSVSQAIGLSADSSVVLNSIIDSLRTIVPYDSAAVFLLDARTLEVAEETVRGYPVDKLDRLALKVGEGIVGWSAKTGQAVIVPDVRTDPRYVAARPETCSEIVAPLKIGGEVIGVFNLESDRPNAYSPHDLRLLETFANHAAIAIERSRHLRQEIEQERLVRELAIARRIQLSFLPDRDPGWPGFDVSGYNISSEEVSGDFFDYIPISASDWGLVIADVSGKGVPASLIMASLRAALWTEAHNTYSLSEICARVNEFLYQSLGETEFVTAVYGVLNLKNRLFTYANAGHLPPIHLKPNGDVAYLETGGLILGAFPGSAYEESWVKLAAGDVLLFYTDGSVEAIDADGEEFGRDRLVDCLKAVRDKSARQIRTELVEAVRRFAGRDQLADDLTFIVVKSLP